MNAVFVSYRRGDSAGWTGRLVASLRQQFPSATIFMDIQEIRAGRDFREAIEGALASSRVVLAVIGPRWLEPEAGRRRLFEIDDLVSLEISRALALPDVHVIPVLVGEARLPSADELPESLAPLVRRQAFQLSDSRWEYDLARLAKTLTETGLQRGKTLSSVRRYAYAGVTLIALSAVGLVSYMSGQVPTPSGFEVDKQPHRVTATPDLGQATAPRDSTQEQPQNKLTVPERTAEAVAQPQSKSEPRLLEKLDGVWAGDFAHFTDDSRRREVIQLEVDGKTVYGRSWQETWLENAREPRRYREYPFANGTIEGNTISFCVKYAYALAKGSEEKHRNCYIGSIQRDSIAFRVTYEVNETQETKKFVARRIAP
jgi:hypothetical protein